MKKYTVFFLLCFGSQISMAQSPSHIFSWGTQLHYGSIFAHSQEVENTAGSHPYGIELTAIWQKISQKVWDNCLCTPKMGFNLSYYNYDNAVLGQSANLGYFLEPNFKLYKDWELSLRGTFGFSYLTNPYDSIRNPNNRSYSLPVSVYLLMGLGNHVKLNQHWRLGAYLNYQHISNGGLKEPNKGINWITTSLSLVYTPEIIEIPVQERTPFNKKKPLELEAYTFVSSKTTQVGEQRRYPILGIGVALSKQVSRLNSLMLSAEGCHDAAVEQKLTMEQKPGDGWRASILTGHQFILGNFRFSQQVGYYLYQNNEYFKPWFHRWGLMYYPTSRLGVGFNMKAHLHIANFVDFRLSYKLKK